jgi:beta-lactamase regulating signal transducer with metallopeptidase domain
MIGHLLVSTFVLGIALAAARTLPLRARTRHTLLLLGIAAFFVPPLPILRFEPSRGPSIIRIVGRMVGPNAPEPSLPVRTVIGIGYDVVALWIAARLFIGRRRFARTLTNASPASEREVTSLAKALDAVGLGGPLSGVLLVRADVDSPALAGAFRHTIVLPRFVDDLDDDELHALLLHECAHLARRDNLAAVFEEVAATLLWFHPLVWLARRELHIAREEACDEMVVGAADDAPYLSALAKVCRAAIAPRTAGVSCMANNRVKERIAYMKNLSSLRSLSHRAVVALAILLIALTAAAAGIVQNVAAPAPRGTSADKPAPPISLNLKDADVRDVLKTFGALTGKTMDVASDVNGKVTLTVENVPWTEVLQEVVSQVGAKARIDGDTIHVTK